MLRTAWEFVQGALTAAGVMAVGFALGYAVAVVDMLRAVL